MANQIAAIAETKKNMKTENKLYLLVVTTAALALNPTTGVGQVFNSEDVINNRAVAASPRAKEEFPWLTRSGIKPTRSKEAVAKSKSALEVVKENTALAASPRMKELYPELTRPAVTPSEIKMATQSRIKALAEVRRNTAFAASPRMKELFPELARGVKQTIEIAPRK